ncbi:MAG: DNA polymerase I, partial [Ruminiclostridium sp.]|nr:DNA polymerase I [Ruminiclostridium sp.]
MKLLVIDGNSIINRAFYGIRALTNSKGVFTNAVTGFMNIYLKLIAELQPDAAAAAFDRREPTFRHQKYDGYKAGRKGMPDELAMQLPYVKELLRAFGVKVLECAGYEADDILGTLSAMCEEQGGECILSTGDRDSFQLITDRVSVNLAANREDIFYTPEKIREVYGVSPAEMLEVKALMGDGSDNIPGVPGIGEKTALSLIREYHTVDSIYEKLDELNVTNSVREKLKKGEESCRLSRWLGTICKTAPIGVTPEDCRFGARDEEKLAEILTELEMFALLKKLKLSKTAVENAAAKTAAKISAEGQGAVGELDPSVPDYLLLDGTLHRFLNGEGSVVPVEEYEAALSDDSPKRTFDLKGMLSETGIEIGGVVFDSTLAAYLLHVNAADYGFER